jgi:hypothetical protein
MCRFSQANLSDLTNMKVGEDMLPANDQFPDVDPIAVLNHDPWESEETETPFREKFPPVLVLCYKRQLVQVTSAHNGRH